jgi:opacity protein-like surface antigen
VATGLSLFALASPASAQHHGTGDLVARVEALETQVRDLRGENAALRAEIANIKKASPLPAPAATVASSGTIPSSATPPPLLEETARGAAPELRWNRAYVGISAGFTQTRNRQLNGTENGLFFFHSNKTGPSIALKLGRRWQWGELVSGLELQGVLTKPVDIQNFGGPDQPTYTAYRPRSYVNLKGQLGWDAGPLLVYATGGVRFTQVHNIVLEGQGPSDPGPDNVTSLMYGGGVAVPLSGDLSFDIEATVSKLRPHLVPDGNRATLIDALAGVELDF